MITSLFIPVVLGNLPHLGTRSIPVRQAAVPSVNAEAAPEVTMAASAADHRRDPPTHGIVQFVQPDVPRAQHTAKPPPPRDGINDPLSAVNGSAALMNDFTCNS